AGLGPGKGVRVWLPVPPTLPEQDVKVLTPIPPGGRIAKDPKFGNRILCIDGKANRDGKFPVEMTYRVTRREVLGKGGKLDGDMEELARFLKPDRMVPIDGKPLELLKGKEVPKDEMAAAKLFYDVVNGHMRYSKEGTG